MRRLRVALAFVPAAALVIVASACGDDDDTGAGPRDGGLSETGPDAIGTGDAIAPDEDAGAFTVVDVADVPCTTRVGSERLLYPATDFTAISSLAAIGDRRVAQRYDGFVLMDADGQNASPAALSPSSSVTVIGDVIAAVGARGNGPFLSFHSASGATTVPAALAESGPTLGVFAGGNAGAGLMVWASQFGVRARGFDKTTFLGPAFFLAGAAEVQGFSASVVRKSDGTFGVAFSGESIGAGADALRRLSFVRATTTGSIPVGFNLEIGALPRQVVQLVARPAGGWALLFNYGNDFAAHLAFLSEEGRIEGPIRRFVGTSSALALAMSGDELGVLAFHPAGGAPTDAGADAADLDSGADAGTDAGDSGATSTSDVRVAFRPLGADGNPLAGWVCIGGGVPTTTIAGAMMAEDNGYTAAYSRANGEVVFARFDRRGN